MIKLVCFDLDGVFFEKIGNKFFEEIAEKLTIEVDFLKDVLFRRAAIEGGYNKLKTGKINSDEYWNWLWKTLGVEGKFSKDEYISILSKYYKTNELSVKLISELRELGIKTAICSNNWSDNIEMLQNKFRLSKYFDFQIYSFQVGFLKPDKRIYQALVDKSGLKPSEIFYSDDKEEFVKVAREFRFNSIQYKNFAEFKEHILKSIS